MDYESWISEDEMSQKREDIGRGFAIGFYSFYSELGSYEKSDLGSFKKAIAMTEEVLEHSSAEDAQKILGGEFDIRTLSNPIDEQVSSDRSVPLYFLIDLIGGAIAQRKPKIENRDELLKEMAALRGKLSKLHFSSYFKPEEVISRDVIEDILDIHGDFSLSVKEKEGITHLAYDGIRSSAPHMWKNGDIYSAGPVSLAQIGTKTLYTSDAEKIKEIEYEKSKQKLAALREVTAKYFKDGKIPEMWQVSDKSGLNPDVAENLDERGLNPDVAENLDERILGALRDIAFEKSKHRLMGDIVLADYTYDEVEKVKEAEQQIEEERRIREEQERQEKIEKDMAIKKAKERYDSKSLLWKFVNKARLTFGTKSAEATPDKVDFDELKTDEINDLYSDEKGRGK